VGAHVLVIDDGSTDDTLALTRGRNDPRSSEVVEHGGFVLRH
jgi:hypothetical protein